MKKNQELQRTKSLKQRLAEIEFDINKLSPEDREIFENLPEYRVHPFIERWRKLERCRVRKEYYEDCAKSYKYEYKEMQHKKDTRRKCQFGGVFAEVMGRPMSGVDYKVLWVHMMQDAKAWRDHFNDPMQIAGAVAMYDKAHPSLVQREANNERSELINREAESNQDLVLS